MAKIKSPQKLRAMQCDVDTAGDMPTFWLSNQESWQRIHCNFFMVRREDRNALIKKAHVQHTFCLFSSSGRYSCLYSSAHACTCWKKASMPSPVAADTPTFCRFS